MPERLKGEWKYTKALAISESDCRPKVCSSSNACGVMQILQRTWGDISDVPYNKGIYNPAYNIEAGIAYLASLAKQWDRRGRKPREVLDLAAASYNAGLGNILKAQRLCGISRLWGDIAPCLYKVTGKNNASSTIEYIKRINFEAGD